VKHAYYSEDHLARIALRKDRCSELTSPIRC